MGTLSGQLLASSRRSMTMRRCSCSTTTEQRRPAFQARAARCTCAAVVHQREAVHARVERVQVEVAQRLQYQRLHLQQYQGRR